MNEDERTLIESSRFVSRMFTPASSFDRDDLTQEAALSILKSGQLQSPHSYQIQVGKRGVGNFVRRMTGCRRKSGRGSSPTPPGVLDQEYPAREIGTAGSVESADLVQALYRVADPVDRVILDALRDGFTKVGAGRKAGISGPAVTYRIHRLVRRVGEVE